MKIDFKQVLYEECKKHDIELNDKQLTMLELYKNMMLEYNEKVNLTAITDDYEIILKHFVDCLEIVKYMENDLNVIDVGTGAGFPGIVIAIYFNENIKITLLDALNKRIAFLEEVVKTLELSSVRVIHGRAEEIACNDEYREKYDLVVSRAVASLPVLLEYDIPFLKVGGECLLLKSNNAEIEINNARNAMKILNCKITNIYEYSYNIDDEIFTRKVINIQKINNTPKKYPRNYGKIKKSPL